MTLNDALPDADALLAAVKQGLDAYAEEAPEYADAEIADVLVVGSAGTDTFRPGDSDLDVCVIVTDAPKPGVQTGFDTFLREDWHGCLVTAAKMDVDGVDVGAYDADNHTEFIDDKQAFSCQWLRWKRVE